jgi:signal transduction histidine kinase
LAQSNFEKSEKLTQEVLQSMEAKDIFISMMSHEIRNPLNAMKTSVEYLIQVVKDQVQLSVLKNARLSGEVLLNLLNNVLDAAKLKSDKMEISPIETDFVNVVEKALTINSEFLKDKEIFAKAWVSQDLPGLMWLDPSRLLQILLNLLSNAIKFTSKEGKIDIYVSWLDDSSIQNHDSLLKPLIRIGESASLVRDIGTEAFLEEMNLEENKSFTQNMESLSHQYQFNCKYNFNDVSPSNASKRNPGKSNKPWEILKVKPFQRNQYQGSSGYLKVQVQDTGCGIAEDQLSRLFGMFEQSREHARMASGGTGLGLWVCKQLCQKMNGDITVYSQKDKGTSFVFYLPIENNNVRMTSILRSHSPAKILRALVIDDYATNRYMHKLFLEEQGVHVSVACDGQEAVEKYKNNRENPFDLVLMDVHMPVMDGFSAASRIRQWEQTKNLPKAAIYFVTGEYFSEEDVLRIFQERGGGQIQGIQCLKKPLQTEIIKDIVCKLK